MNTVVTLYLLKKTVSDFLIISTNFQADFIYRSFMGKTQKSPEVVCH